MLMYQHVVCNQKKVFLVLFASCVLLVCYQYKYSIPSQCHRFESPRRYAKSQTQEDSWTQPITDNASTTTATPIPTRCAPREHVMFLKTHKTGSSTLTNILNRYADQHSKSVLLPKGSVYYSFDWPNKFRLNSAVSSYGRPNFLANHARYSRKSMNVLFPRKNTLYISVLRHPVSQWESTFQYMSFPYILDISYKEDAMDFFLNNPPSTSNIMEIARRYPSLYLIRNPLFFDLGLDHRDYDNATFIRRALKTLDDDFDLFLIMEHFDESLTLLRRRLCWDIDDVVYFKMNERLSQNKRNVVSNEQTEKIKAWNNADMVLYNYFVEKFWRQIKDEGAGFYDEVLELKRRRKEYSKICIEGEAIEEAYTSVFVKGYTMKKNLRGNIKVFCERMLKNEIHYMDYFRGKRTKWIDALEGETIVNFENSVEEADMFVEMPEIKRTAFQYGAPPPKKPKRQMGLKTTAYPVTYGRKHKKKKRREKNKRILNELETNVYDNLGNGSTLLQPANSQSVNNATRQIIPRGNETDLLSPWL